MDRARTAFASSRREREARFRARAISGGGRCGRCGRRAGVAARRPPRENRASSGAARAQRRHLMEHPALANCSRGP
ncbi:MAG: hypothetical protein OXU61_11470 [Gammaproteobacteria bacterium]|nr:hypothetical protein [Gammaproteobacteria bacterium]